MSLTAHTDDSSTEQEYDTDENPSHAQDYERPPKEVRDARAED